MLASPASVTQPRNTRDLWFFNWVMRRHREKVPRGVRGRARLCRVRCPNQHRPFHLPRRAGSYDPGSAEHRPFDRTPVRRWCRPIETSPLSKSRRSAKEIRRRSGLRNSPSTRQQSLSLSRQQRNRRLATRPGLPVVHLQEAQGRAVVRVAQPRDLRAVPGGTGALPRPRQPRRVSAVLRRQRAVLSVTARVAPAVGTPGHHDAGRGRSRASTAAWEARVALRWRF